MYVPPTAVPESTPIQSPGVCASGFSPRESITAAVTTMTNNQEQRIIPDITLKCNGSITQWIMKGEWTSGGQRTSFPHLQIWRETSTDTYVRIGSTEIAAQTESVTEVYMYPVEPPLPFQAGDVLGIFQPAQQRSLLSVYYVQDSTGPTNHYVGLAVADEMPVSEMFTVTGVNTENALPLVTVEIGRLLHYSV